MRDCLKMRRRLAAVMLSVLTLFMAGCGEAAQTAEDDAEAAETAAEMEAAQETTASDEAAGESDEPEPTDAQSKEPESVTILMVGDILLHDPIEDAARREDGSYDFSAIFENTDGLISSADLALVNQEVIIGGEELGISGYPAFNAPYEIGDALSEAGFDVVLHATNHALDKGSHGITNCLAYWESEHPDIEVIGINDSTEAQNEIHIEETGGIRIAILNYTYGTNGIPLPDGMPYAVNLMDEAHKEHIAEQLAKARKLADFVIVCPHWGIEYQTYASAEQERWAQFFTDNGADLIIGTHPHVIESVELLTEAADGSETVCYYSLGNFVNWTSEYGDRVAERVVGGMAEVTISRGDDGEVSIADYGVRALVTQLSEGRDGVTVYPLSGYDEAMAAENRIRLQDAAFDYEYCVTLCDDVWGGLWY